MSRTVEDPWYCISGAQCQTPLWIMSCRWPGWCFPWLHQRSKWPLPPERWTALTEGKILHAVIKHGWERDTKVTCPKERVPCLTQAQRIFILQRAAQCSMLSSARVTSVSFAVPWSASRSSWQDHTGEGEQDRVMMLGIRGHKIFTSKVIFFSIKFFFPFLYHEIGCLYFHFQIILPQREVILWSIILHWHLGDLFTGVGILLWASSRWLWLAHLFFIKWKWSLMGHKVLTTWLWFYWQLWLKGRLSRYTYTYLYMYCMSIWLY